MLSLYVIWYFELTGRGRVYRSRINVAVLHLLEREELQKLQKKWWYDKGECVVETDKVRD